MKDIKCIPQGDYCYTIEKVMIMDNGKFVLKTKYCPYYIHDEHGYCSFLDLYGKNSILLWDGVKECNENIGDEEDYE